MPPTSSANADDPRLKGLTSEEAARRLKRFGPNALPDVRTPPWRRVLSKFWAPVPWMLELAIVLQLVMGEYLQAIVIAVLLLFNASLALIKEHQIQSTLQALKSQLALEASARRDGDWRTIAATDLVPGDIVHLTLGHIVGADVRLLEGEVLLDHSMLTGESLPVEGEPGAQTYAGALVRRGHAIAEVTATGLHTRFGRTAELVQTARVVSTQEKAAMRMVRNLTVFNAVIVLIQLVCATVLDLPVQDIVPLTLTALLAAIPVALAATFTLARVLGAHALAREGVLPAQLSALDEAASLDVLCLDKTGTVTQNALTVTEVWAAPGFAQAQVLALAALASAQGGQDTVDAAIRTAAALDTGWKASPTLTKFIPFDPGNKMSEALATDADGRQLRIVKGAVSRIGLLASADEPAQAAAQASAAKGFRVLAVGIGEAQAPMRIAGLVALSDPPRADSAGLIATLKGMGVQALMVTGDAPATAAVVAKAVGLDGPVCAPGAPMDEGRIDAYAVFAGVSPEDKFRIVKAFQKNGHTVGMCGDGTNDAPALRQAQIGIAVSSATDVAKSAAGIVLTRPGLAGIVATVREGRVTFQRMLTYTLRIMALKLQQLMFLTVGLIMTGQAILTPMLMVLLMITGDFLAMSAASDNVRASDRPNRWRINTVTRAGFIIAACNLLFSTAVLAIGAFWLALDHASLMTLAAVTLVFTRQGLMYAVRERRRLWSSWPSRWLMATSMADLGWIAVFAGLGILMAPLPWLLIAGVFAAEIGFAFVLDEVKYRAFRRLDLT